MKMIEHKHAELLRAIADGENIEFVLRDKQVSGWYEQSAALLGFIADGEEFLWRIKPVKKPSITREMFIEANPSLDNAYNEPNVKFTFDGDTQKLIKAEIIE